ncbi:MAG TPA: bifunctional biotin--[acetyl-CoA-carboxylase] ligase/biotin operon repressor BirA [Arenimonas sp.]|nr:bifunctional biotin--[acetyl-CoA-carboxylase] ligase/biotin operon repressor BirA [Arenimonas sp.]
MSAQDDQHRLLQRLAHGPASGADLARELGCTRSAVWKRVEALRAAGVEIDALAGRGYALARPLRLLDAASILAALPADARAALADLQLHFDIDSSNALALREPVPERGCRVFLCERQRAGRGRRGRTWASPLAAHLYLTVSRRFDGGIAALQGLSLAVGVAVAEALHDLGYAGVGLKWPNDLYAGGRKLGGILIEIGGEAGGPVRAAIGLGLNVAMPTAAAQGIDQPWCDLAMLREGTVPDRNTIAAAVLGRLLPALARFAQHGLGIFMDEWARFDVLAGQAVRVFDAGGEQEGIALGVAADGALRVAQAQGEVRFHSGEVSVRAAWTG